MLPFFSFWWKCIKEASAHAWATAGIIGTALALFVPFVIWIKPKWLTPTREVTVNDWVWQIPLTALIATFAVCFILSPYWIYQRKTAEIVQLHDQLDDRQKRQEVLSRLGQFIEQGRMLRIECANETKPPPVGETQKWSDDVEAFLSHELGSGYVARFRNDSGMPLTATSISSIAHRNLWSGINARLWRLDQFFQEEQAPKQQPQ